MGECARDVAERSFSVDACIAPARGLLRPPACVRARTRHTSRLEPAVTVAFSRPAAWPSPPTAAALPAPGAVRVPGGTAPADGRLQPVHPRVVSRVRPARSAPGRATFRVHPGRAADRRGHRLDCVARRSPTRAGSRSSSACISCFFSCHLPLSQYFAVVVGRLRQLDSQVLVHRAVHLRVRQKPADPADLHGDAASWCS